MPRTRARKWVAVDFGGPEVLRSTDVDVPDPGRGEVARDVRVAGMNPASARKMALVNDHWTRRGQEHGAEAR